MEINPTQFIANTYSRFPIILVRGEGVYVWDNNGNKYLDCVAGIAVCSLGHSHPEISKVLCEQSKKLIHVSNLFWIEPQLKLAELLVRHSFADKVFFCNSGAESVEAAIKLARRYGYNKKGPDCYEIICLKGSFHGRTLATVTATGQEVFKKGFGPLVPGFLHVPPNDVTSLRAAFNNRTTAVLIEPIQGEGGVRPIDDEFLQEARLLCDEFDALLMFDEVQVGMGRTGTLFAYEQTPVVPDVMCLAKALGNGVPIGAMLAKETVMEHLSPGSHASTFGGNPLACSVAAKVLEIISKPDFLYDVKEKGKYLYEGLLALKDKFSEKIKDVRGRGLIQAIEFFYDVPEISKMLIDEGLLVILSHGKIVRLVPPLIIKKKEIDKLLEILEKVIAVV